MTYDVGDVVRLSTTTKVDGVLTNATTITLTVKAPDGTTSTPTVVNDSTGAYHADLTVTQSGTYVYRWVATGTAAGAEDGQFDVRPSILTAGAQIISLEDAKVELNKSGVTTRDDAELRTFIEAVTPLVEDYIGGAVVPRTVTETLTAYGSTVFLTHQHVVSVASVTEGDTALAATDYTLSGSMLVRRSGTSDINWSRLPRTVTVTYTAGFSPVPRNIKLAAAEWVAHLWRITQQGSRPAFGDPELGSPVGGDFSEPPNVVKNLLRPYKAAPLVA